EGLEQQRPYHLRLPRLDLRPHRQARAHPAVFPRSAAARRARQGFHGFQAESIVPINNPPAAFRVTGTSPPVTKPTKSHAWFMPFCRTLDIEYPSGLRHIIFNAATPIDDGSIQLVQVLFRNDREEDCSTQELIDWDAAIIEEDREILESTDPDAIVDIT